MTQPAQSLTLTHLSDFEEYVITRHHYHSLPLKGSWERIRRPQQQAQGGQP